MDNLRHCIFYEKMLVEAGYGLLFPLCRTAKDDSGDTEGNWDSYTAVCLPGHMLTDRKAMKKQADQEADQQASIRRMLGVGIGDTFADMDNLNGNVYGKSRSIGAMHIFMSMDVGIISMEDFMNKYSCTITIESYKKKKDGKKGDVISHNTIHVRSAEDLFRADQMLFVGTMEGKKKGNDMCIQCTLTRK